MAIISEKFALSTKGFTDIIDITQNIEVIVAKHKIKDAQLMVYVSGTTAAITTMEYEPGLIKDLKDAFEVFAPSNKVYQHDKTWQEGNGLAHVRAAIIGTSINIPIIHSIIQLGTWQQVVLIDFDNKPRVRKVVLQISY